MERKVGEVFEHKGEWYQCVKSTDGSCRDCGMNFGSKCPIPIKECTESGRSDKTYVIFKKLEKVGEPHWIGKRLMQPYKLFTEAIAPLGIVCFSIWHEDLTIEIEIKQNQEDMEEKKIELRQEDLTYLINKIRCDILPKYTKYDKITEEITKLFAPANDAKLSNAFRIGKNLKPFDLDAARSGKPVCTRDGRKARIICFDAYNTRPMIVLVAEKNVERTYSYYKEGVCPELKDDGDLMMLPEKHEGWVNILKGDDGEPYVGCAIFEAKETAEIVAKNFNLGRIDTVKIEWKE